MDAADSPTVADREIVLVRVFDAPRDLVWAAWSEAEHLKHWWGPNGFSNTFHQFDFRAGGDWRFIMHGPDGTDFKNHNRFVEIRKPDLIVIDHIVEPKFRITATFEDIGGKTKLTFRQVFESAETFERVKPFAVPGSEQTLDRLGQYVAKMAH